MCFLVFHVHVLASKSSYNLSNSNIRNYFICITLTFSAYLYREGYFGRKGLKCIGVENLVLYVLDGGVWNLENLRKLRRTLPNFSKLPNLIKLLNFICPCPPKLAH